MGKVITLAEAHTLAMETMRKQEQAWNEYLKKELLDSFSEETEEVVMTNYILDEEHNPVPEPDIYKYGAWIHNPDNKILAQDTLQDGKFVSTVFLGIDHGINGSGEPMLFETMVFERKGEGADLDVNRYATWKEAHQGHREMVLRYDPEFYERQMPLEETIESYQKMYRRIKPIADKL